MKHTRKLLKSLVALGMTLLLLVPLVSLAAAQTWIQQFPTGTPPAPRYSAGMAYDVANDRLILFSGEDFTGLPRPTDVWVLTDATGLGGTPSWVELFPTGGPPLGREGGTTVYAPGSNRIIVFGGCSANCSPALSDVWILENANGLSGMPNWMQLLPSAPFQRTFHSAAYDPGSNRMIVFGGQLAFFGTDQNDVRILENADGMGGSPAWTPLAPSGTPPAAREFASVAYDQANNRMILFGGGTFPDSSTLVEYNDVWVLTNANGLGGTPVWTQLIPTGLPPQARYGHSVVYDAVTNRLIVFGGQEEGPGTSRVTRTTFDDVWVLTNANGLGGTPEWIQLLPAGTTPQARWGYSVGYISVSNRMIVALGRHDTVCCSLFNDVWVLTNANGIIEVVIDIKPGSDPNSITPGSRGVIPVAVLTTVDLDAADVDPATVLFGATGTEAAPVRSALEDADGDGDVDLVLHFRTQATGIACGDTSASLTGETFGGQDIEGSDTINTVGCK